MIRPSGTIGSVSIELTPIIDMVFLLLIFFLVATTFPQTEREMQIALPEASAAGPISTVLREIIINVDDQGQIFVSGSRIDAGDLGVLLGATRRPGGGGQPPAKGHGSRGSPHRLRQHRPCA